MSVIYGKKEDFELLTKEGLVLVDFHASWCGPCKMLGPVLETLDIDVLKIDVDECPELSREHGIMSVPTLMLFNEGELKGVNSGFMPKEMLENWINENK